MCFVFLSFWIAGQEITIVDEFTNEALEGVAIYNEDQTLATITNSEGIADLSVFRSVKQFTSNFMDLKLKV